MAEKIPPHYYSGNFSCGFSNEEMVHLAVNYASVPTLISYDEVNSPVSVTSFPEQYIGSEGVQAVPQMSEMEMGFCDRYPNLVFGDDRCGGLVPNLWTSVNYNQAMLPMAENWAKKTEEDAGPVGEVKVGRYSVEERKDRILRYLKKRNQRNFNKTIKYACRKTLADKRVRVRGRFAKNATEISEEEMGMTPEHLHHEYHQHQQNMNDNNNSFYQEQFVHQMRSCTYDDEDEWLQTAMDNLVQLPYLGS